MARLMYIALLYYILYVWFNDAQNVRLTGSGPFAVEDTSYNMICNITVDTTEHSFIFLFIKHKGNSLCRVDIRPHDVYCRPYVNGRYTCKCEDRENIFNMTNITISIGLNITQVKREDEGHWACYDDLSSIRDTLTLPVHNIPIITNMTSDAIDNEIEEGSDVELSCDVDSFPSSVITWTSSRRPDTAQGSIYTISTVTCQHTDNYTCTANNGIGGLVSRTIPVYVKCIPQVIEPLQTDIQASLGQSTSLEIKVDAYPLPKFIWKYRLQDRTEKAITDFRVKRLTTNLTSKLSIERVTEQDFGDYIVYVSNDIGTRTMIFSLSVEEDGPPVTVGPVPVCNCKVQSSDLGSGIGVGIAISLVVVGSLAVIVWCIIKRRKKGTTSVKESATATRNSNVMFYENRGSESQTTQLPSSQVRQDRERTTPSEYQNMETIPPSYESLDTVRPESQTYEQLDVYENCNKEVC